jgi:hypothetical protein
MGRPQPFGVPIAPIGLMPHGPKHLHMPGRGYKNPVGEIIDFVNDPVGYMVEKSLGLRSNKPGEKKEGDAEKKEGEEKVEVKEENKATQNEIATEQKQEPVLRARKKETEEQQEYEEVEYAEEPELEAQQEQAEVAGKLSGYGIKFDSEGNIANYAAIFKQEQAKLNAVYTAFNGMSKDAQDAYQDTVKAAEES